MTLILRLFAPILAALALMPVLAWSDSPLTSTPFYEAYVKACTEGRIQLQATCNMLKKGRLDIEMGNYLVDDAIPLDHRLAVVNSLGWTFGGQVNGYTFMAALDTRPFVLCENRLVNSVEISSEARRPYSPSESIILAYMQAMDNYINDEAVQSALKLAKAGARQLPQESFSAQMICTLLSCQLGLSDAENWDKIWPEYEALAKRFQPESRDMLKEAVEVIESYLKLYQGIPILKAKS